MNDFRDLWTNAVDALRKEYDSKGKKDDFDRWFKLNYLSDDGKKITLCVPSQFILDTMTQRKLTDEIANKIAEIYGSDNITLKYEIKNEQIFDENDDDTEHKTQTRHDDDWSLSEPLAASEAWRDRRNDQKEADSNITIKKSRNSTLNEKFTFENFITDEGSSTYFAYKSSLMAAENPGKKANPILLYGGVGLGKTHLMQAIGNFIYDKYGDAKKICYVQAESFMNEFTDSLLKKTTTAFKNKYRKFDVLLIDDIQFLQGKPGAQQELFYVFEALHENLSQMVFACDRPLSEIADMEERLVSRLGSGMCLDLQPPNFETRKAIIYKKLENQGKTLSDEIVNILAQSVETNVRDLEAAITSVLNYCEILDREINIDEAKSLLKDWATSSSLANVSIDNIINAVADYYRITPESLKNKKRDKRTAQARHVVVYLARKLTEYTFTELGRELKRDHSTIMNSNEKMENEIKISPSLANDITILTKKIKEQK